MTSQLICPTCGLARGLSTLFCRGCGTRFAPEGQAPPPPGAAPSGGVDQDRKCPNCGHMNDAQNVRCLRCGNDLS